MVSWKICGRNQGRLKNINVFSFLPQRSKAEYSNMVNNESNKKSIRDEKSKKEYNFLSGDQPLKNPEDDRLGYKNFAKHLSKALCEMAPVEGMVVSIYGPWGTGKTTVLNFIKHYLHQITEENRPIVIHFNPWWFSCGSDLVASFFAEMMLTLNHEGEEDKKILEGLAGLCEILSSAPQGGFLAIIGKLLKPRTETLYEIRDKIEKHLRDKKRKYIIVIDDIDRLVVDEIREVFKVVKAVANLPNMIYILAFDKDKVASA